MAPSGGKWHILGSSHQDNKFTPQIQKTTNSAGEVLINIETGAVTNDKAITGGGGVVPDTYNIKTKACIW